jgi:hypothetical protein
MLQRANIPTGIAPGGKRQYLGKQRGKQHYLGVTPNNSLRGCPASRWEHVGLALPQAAQPAKTALFAGGNGADVRKNAGPFGPQASFSN